MKNEVISKEANTKPQQITECPTQMPSIPKKTNPQSYQK